MSEEYKEYVRKITPTYQLWKQMVKAFFVGGLICVLGQLVTNVAIQELGMDEQQAGGFCSLALIALSVFYPKSNICLHEINIIHEHAFVNRKYEQIFGIYVCVLCCSMIN